MKLFVITHAYAGDGASHMLHAAASHWTKELGWQVDAVRVPDMSAEAAEAIAASGMRQVERAQFQEGYDFALINCLHNIRFVDFIHPHVPIVLWAHEAETILKSNVPPKQWKAWFAKVSLLVFQTDWQCRLYRKYLPQAHKARVAIVPNGIPPVTVAAKEKQQGDVFRIANVGKLAPVKGQADLIHAVSALADNHRLHCDLVGDTEHLSHIEILAQEILARQSQLFTLSGYLPRHRALEKIAQADVFCFPSHSESFGLAPLEAAALAVPVILADLAPYRLIGWVSGENCLTFPAGDRIKLAGAIETLMRDAALRRKIATGGKALAERYAMSACVAQLSGRILKLIPDAQFHIA